MNLDLKKFCEISKTDLAGLIAEMFTFTEWGIDEKDIGDYQKARDEIKKKRLEKKDVTLEDVYAEMLRMGLPVVATDPDGEEHDFTLEMVEKGIDNLLIKDPQHFADFITENSDACSGLALIDCCVFGEPTFC